jgi:hypothetical protein
VASCDVADSISKVIVVYKVTQHRATKKRGVPR